MTDVPEAEPTEVAEDSGAPAERSAPAPSVAPVSSKRKRVSRWDRPKEPHDWRWVVGHIGRALITTGLLMFGFVAYQLWGTGIQTQAAQDDLASEFNQFIADNGITPDTIGPATTTTVGISQITDPTLPNGDPSATSSTVAPVDIVTTTPTTAEPEPQNYGVVKPGDALARIKIHKIGLDFLVVAGVSSKDLGKGIGHFANTPLPGQLGNSALAGHRTSHLAPFYDLDKLQPGDEVEVRTKLGDAYLFIVTDSLVVQPSDYYVVTDTDPTKATLTLITCTPKLSSKQRLVVHATLDTSRSSPVGAPQTYYGENEPGFTADTLPPDEPAASVPVSNVDVPVTLPAEDSPTSASVSATLPDETTATSVSAPVAGDGSGGSGGNSDVVAEFSDNAFSQGWFDDGAAWPHVIAWGLLFGLIWVVCYQFVARRYRRMWLGIAVAAIPVVVVLYFFYENVNRLLPAAI